MCTLSAILFVLSCLLAGRGDAANVVNGVDLDKACPQYESLAQIYCRPSADEPPAVKPKCDLYRKYCSSEVKDFTPAPAFCRQVVYCSQYSGQSSLICKNTAYANSDTDRQRFCQSYKQMCDNVPEDPKDECGAKKGQQGAAAVPNPRFGPQPSPGLYRLTDLNGGGPMATVGQSSIDNIKGNMAASAANAPLFKILGGLAGGAAKAAGSATGQAAGGNVGDIGSGLLSGSASPSGPTAPYGPGLGVQTLPGFDAAAQRGPFGTSPLTVGNSIGVGPFASAGSLTAVNPFGKVGWANTWGAMGFSGYSGGGVDYGSVPGLTDLNNPLVSGKRRRREVMKTMRVNSFYRFLYGH